MSTTGLATTQTRASDTNYSLFPRQLSTLTIGQQYPSMKHSKEEKQILAKIFGIGSSVNTLKVLEPLTSPTRGCMMAPLISQSVQIPVKR